MVPLPDQPQPAGPHHQRLHQLPHLLQPRQGVQEGPHAVRQLVHLVSKRCHHEELFKQSLFTLPSQE